MKKLNDRKNKGILTSAVGIICNLTLAAAKIAIGFLFGLVSVVADGFNNLSDCGSSVVSLVSFHISDKPADKEHPFGHRRAEYIASMITAFFILFLAIELLMESIEKIINNVVPDTSWIVFLVLGISIVVKTGMFFYYRIMAKKLDSDTLKAAAIDSLCDCISTSAVIIGLVILHFTGFAADGWAGILVSLFIIWQGLKILLEASSKLLGQAPDQELMQNIKENILKNNKVLGIHDLRVYTYGKGVSFATVHIEMDANLPSLESHAVIDEIEQEIKETLNISLTAHLDPIDLQDTEAQELEKNICNLAKNLSEQIEIHDFRLIRGSVNKIIFDVCVSYSCKKSDEELRVEIEEIIKSLGEYNSVITIDRQ